MKFLDIHTIVKVVIGDGNVIMPLFEFNFFLLITSDV